MIDNPSQVALKMAEQLRSGVFFTVNGKGAIDPHFVSSVGAASSDAILHTFKKLTEQATADSAGPIERSILYSYSKQVLSSRSASPDLKKEAQKVSDLSYSLMSNGSLSSDQVGVERSNKTDFWNFMKANNLFHNHNSFDFKTGERGKIIIVNGQHIDFYSLTKEETDSSFIFKQGDTPLFKTDKRFKLQDAFYAGVNGIEQKDPTTPYLLGTDMHKPSHKVEGTGKYKVLVMTGTINHHQNNSFGGLLGDHAFLGIESPNGYRTFYGQLAKPEFASDPKWMLAAQPCLFKSPDSYASLPLTNYQTTLTPIEIDESQANRLKEYLDEKMHDKAAVATFLHSNCTMFVKNALKTVDIDVACTTTAYQEYKRLIFGDRYRNFGTIARIGAEALFHVIYLFTGFGRLLTMTVWTVSLFQSTKDHPSQVSLRNALVPELWEISTPLALRQWQLAQQQTKMVS